MSAYSDVVDGLSPLAYFRLNDASGTQITDSTANVYHGVYVNSPILGVNGALQNDVDKAVQFVESSTHYGKIYAYLAGISTGAFTVNILFKTTDTGSVLANALFALESTTGTALLISVADTGQISFYNETIGSLSLGSGYNDGNWHNVTVTIKAAGGGDVYVDTVLIGTHTFPLPVWGNMEYSELGCEYAGTGETAGNLFEGTLDEVSIFNAELSSANILDLHHAFLGGSENREAPIRIYLSGGASNPSPDLSIGGVISSVEPTFMDIIWHVSTPANWLDIDYCFGLNANDQPINSADDGYIIRHIDDVLELYTEVGDDLGVVFDTVDTMGIDGKYTLNTSDGSGGVVVNFIKANIDNNWWDFQVFNPLPNMFTNITAAQSRAGKTDYRCIYYKNIDLASRDIDLYIPSGIAPEVYEIGFDSAGVDGTATTIANDITAPSGVTFTAATQIAPLNVVLLEDEYIALWIKRTIPAGNITAKSNSLLNIVASIV